MQTAATQLALFSDNEMLDELSGFSVRASGRAKRLSIKVFPRGRVEVVVPKRTGHREVRAFVEAHRDWITNVREKFAADYVPEPFALPTTVGLPGIDRQYTVAYRPEPVAATVKHRTQSKTLVLSGATGNEVLCVAALKRWLTCLAKKEYAPRLRALSDRSANHYSALHVRGQRTCWGSHSSSGTISLNYCLMFLEPAQLRYVMIHELCHARHMNHSSRFWRHVAEFEPNYKTLDAGLNSSWKQIPTWLGIY